MPDTTIIEIDQNFFSALLVADIAQLETLLTGDFIMVDVFQGSIVDKAALLGVIGSGQLVFDSIEQVEAKVRIHGPTGIVVGRTAMTGSFAGSPFAAKSRYTHVFVQENGKWQFVSAQGTQIVE